MNVFLEDVLEDFKDLAGPDTYQYILKGASPLEVQYILEYTSKQLLHGAEKKRKQRAKHLTTRYMGINPNRGWIRFVTHSQYTPSIKYTQYIELSESKDIKYFKEFKPRDIVRLLLSGDIRVSCTCPDFKYRYSYKAYKNKYGLKRENRFPKVRNPKLNHTICKHLIVVLSVLGSNWMVISRDMVKTRYFRKRYSEEDSH